MGEGRGHTAPRMKKERGMGMKSDTNLVKSAITYHFQTRIKGKPKL